MLFFLGMASIAAQVDPPVASQPPDAYQTRYATHLDIADSVLNLTNVGTQSGIDPAGRICANVYTFDPAEEMISCCSCLVTPNGLESLSAQRDLISNSLTPGVPTSINIVLLASTPNGGTCNPASPSGSSLAPGLRASSTTLHVSSLGSAPTMLNFEGFADSTVLGGQYPGVTFANALVITAGISLNEFESPPHSGVNVVTDNGGPISITFGVAQTRFSGYFTYVHSLTLTAFDVHGNQVAETFSHFNNNTSLSGDSGSNPNELLQVSFSGGISKVVITGSLTGDSFVLDDATYGIDVGYAITESPFLPAVLSVSELSKLTQSCSFIQTDGSGFGVCKSCRLGGLGAGRK